MKISRANLVVISLLLLLLGLPAFCTENCAELLSFKESRRFYNRLKSENYNELLQTSRTFVQAPIFFSPNQLQAIVKKFGYKKSQKQLVGTRKEYRWSEGELPYISDALDKFFDDSAMHDFLEPILWLDKVTRTVLHKDKKMNADVTSKLRLSTIIVIVKGRAVNIDLTEQLHTDDSPFFSTLTFTGETTRYVENSDRMSTRGADGSMIPIDSSMEPAMYGQRSVRWMVPKHKIKNSRLNEALIGLGNLFYSNENMKTAPLSHSGPTGNRDKRTKHPRVAILLAYRYW